MGSDSARKHRFQMTDKEIYELESYIHNVSTWFNTPHQAWRAKRRAVPPSEVLDTIKSGQIIEIHNNNAPDIRAVMRKDFYRDSVCVVVSLVYRRIITVYTNSLDDQHYTLDASKYRWSPVVGQIMEQFA